VAMFMMLKRELTANPKRQLGALLAQNAFRAIRRRLDPEIHSGAPLLGFNGTVMKAHGSARERAIANAIHITTEAVQHRVNQVIASEIARANERLSAAEVAAFETEPFFREAIRIRHWDDSGKVAGMVIPDLSSYRALLEAEAVRAA